MKFRTLENAALNDNFGLLAKAMSGDMVFSLSQTTASPTVAECTAAAQVYNITVSLTTAAGELHSWYNGKVFCVHTWYAREYEHDELQRERINKIIERCEGLL